MSSKVAKLYESAEVGFEIKLDSGHGILPSICKCGGALDFKRIDGKTVLVCRDCKSIVDQG